MSDRKNLKISESVYERLNEYKPSSSTWSSFLGHLQDAYRDPRPRLPRLSREIDKPIKLGDLASEGGSIAIDSPERVDLAEIAEGLLDEINFRKICRESDNPTEAKEQLLKVLLLDPELSGVNPADDNHESANTGLSDQTDMIAEKVANRVVARLNEANDE